LADILERGGGRKERSYFDERERNKKMEKQTTSMKQMIRRQGSQQAHRISRKVERIEKKARTKPL
jgi:hypothetical protein